jgi:DNA-binding GntR family transcriptional regulator
VSRPTIRRAMQALGEQGLLVRQRGVGTTVAPARVHRRAVLSSLHDDLVDDGLRPSTTVLSLDEVTDAVAATALELDPRTPLLHLSRLRAVDGRPLALMHNWLPVPREPLEAEELERGGLYAALRRRGAVPRVARQTVTARMPGAVERRQLDLPRGRPVLAMTRTAFGSQGEPVEHGQHCYDAAAYSLDLVLDER